MSGELLCDGGSLVIDDDPILIEEGAGQSISIDADESRLISSGPMEDVILLDAVPEFTIIGLGEQGPAGPPGSYEDEVPYAKRTDFVSDALIYRGEAAPGTAESAALWRIRRIDIGVDGDVSETYAGGAATFNQVWANRASLSYS